MLGWAIVKHSVQQVWENRDEALLLTLFPYGILVVLQVLFPEPQQLQLEAGPDMELPPVSMALGYVFVAIVGVIVSLWIAVLWHRLILVNERGQGYIPRWHGSRMASYFGRGLAIAFLIGVCFAIAGGILGTLFGQTQGSMVVILVFLGAIAIWAFYRLCAVLPAAAIDDPLTFAEAWNATKGQGGTIFVLVLVFMLGSLLMQLPLVFFGDPSGTLFVVYSAVVGWFLTLIGASVLTTFYRVFIEKRPLD